MGEKKSGLDAKDTAVGGAGAAAMALLLVLAFGGNGNTTGHGTSSSGHSSSPETTKPAPVVSTAPAIVHGAGKAACGSATSSIQLDTPKLEALVQAAHTSRDAFEQKWDGYSGGTPVPCHVTGYGGRYTDSQQHGLENQLLDEVGGMYRDAFPGIVYGGTVGQFELDAG
jgi:hypothetical protein